MNPNISKAPLAPSAPSEPTAPPPSYDEAMANAGVMPHPAANLVPYPVGPSAMPMPADARLSQPPMHMPPIPPYPIGAPGMPMAMPMPEAPYNKGVGQTTMPMPPNYSGPSEAAGVLQVQPNADPSFSRLPVECRVIHHHRVVTLSPYPVKMSCPVCQTDIKTNTTSDHRLCAHICCIALFIFGCCICSYLPYCINAFRYVHHFCPNCKNYIGTWKG